MKQKKKKREGSECSCKVVFILLCHCMKEHAGRWCLSPVKAAIAVQARPGDCLMRGVCGGGTSDEWFGDLRCVS